MVTQDPRWEMRQDELHELGSQEQKVAALEQRFDRLERKIDGLVRAWEAAGALVGFVKLAASVVTALGILWAVIKTARFTH